jgi:hypothetical protein
MVSCKKFPCLPIQGASLLCLEFIQHCNNNYFLKYFYFKIHQNNIFLNLFLILVYQNNKKNINFEKTSFTTQKQT